ncbi:hypothetical protein [Noviherbaspirillum autotrophicum]|uniref:Uncharacterized protein n=1 Tax=Noviherbaspirillum autotrophicum TaxID=709839 RepID=A0A0C2BYG0_9BURK|nr:hypothetical protein [Noviherbaspirillum autotrophicum]KIF83076.1 hypothetical protein TSA66_23140 [Noviherbaspirillum autotrophicum]
MASAADYGGKEENEMKFDLKHRLAILPLLACSASALATEPVVLSTQDMDRVTAGAQPVLARFANAIDVLQGMRADLGLTGDQLAWLMRLASSGLVAVHWAETPASSLSQSDDAMTTHVLQPGEALKIQQVGANGTNYLYIYSTGNSSVTVSQQHL